MENKKFILFIFIFMFSCGHNEKEILFKLSEGNIVYKEIDYKTFRGYFSNIDYCYSNEDPIKYKCFVFFDSFLCNENESISYEGKAYFYKKSDILFKIELLFVDIDIKRLDEIKDKINNKYLKVSCFNSKIYNKEVCLFTIFGNTSN